jgi:fumarylpyruvate hydrolase
MKTLLFDIDLPTLPVQGSSQHFPVNRIFCAGRNYAEHAREMGADGREAPFFFSKPASAVVHPEGCIPYPSHTSELHHEVELVVALDKGGRDLSPSAAEDCIFAYGVGIDFTRRDLQAEAKRQGRPWDMAKGFDAAAPVGVLTPIVDSGLILSGNIELSVNGVRRQRGDVADMIWPVNDIIAELSRYLCLRPGDLIFSGTPAGVSAVQTGDRIEASIDGLQPLHLRMI